MTVTNCICAVSFNTVRSVFVSWAIAPVFNTGGPHKLCDRWFVRIEGKCMSNPGGRCKMTENFVIYHRWPKVMLGAKTASHAELLRASSRVSVYYKRLAWMAYLIFSPSISHICPNCYPTVFLKLVDSCIIQLAPPSQALVFALQITRCWTQLFSAHDRYTLSFELTHPPPCLSFCCLLLHNIYSVFCRLPFQTRTLGVLSSPIVSGKSGKGWASLFWWRHNSS